MHKNSNDRIETTSVPSLEEEYGIGVYFTSRIGDVCNKDYDCLNLSFNVGDDRSAVIENRNRLSKLTEVSLDHWVFCRQVHGCRIQYAGRCEWGRGAYDYESAIPRTDALITEEGSTAIGILTADCLPVVMVAGSKRICAVAHAGWRGLLYGVVPRTYNILKMRAGKGFEDIEVFIGPHIRSCCFRVGEDIARMFPRETWGINEYSSQGQGINISLESALITQLAREGVPESNIKSVKICTSCDDRYFSYRREKGNTGRQAGVAVIY